MIIYNITIDNGRVYLENPSRESLQLSEWEYNILMLYPMKSKEEIMNIFFEKNKSLGKAKVENIVNTAFKILGRE